MDDNEIMELYFCRDESAIARTKEKYDAKCKSIALSVLGNRQDAEEAVADAYLAVWNRIGKERPASFSAYLFKVVRNQSLTKYDLVNASKRKPIRQLEELDECIPSGFDLQKVAESADT